MCKSDSHCLRRTTFRDKIATRVVSATTRASQSLIDPVLLVNTNMTNDNGDDAGEKTAFWLKVIVPLIPFLLMLKYSAISTGMAAIVLAFKKSMYDSVKGDFVAREAEESMLWSAIYDNDLSLTVLVFGDRGCGKTSMIQHMLKNRRGVMTVKIKNDNRARDVVGEATQQLHVLGNVQNRSFLEETFGWFSWFPWVSQPILVCQLEERCSASALEDVLVMAKTLSYGNRGRGHARILVEISGSRAAIELGGSFLAERRVQGVRVGDFNREEALEFLKSRMPENFSDLNRRVQLAERIVDKIERRAIWLEEVAKLLGDDLKKRIKNDEPIGVGTAEQVIDSYFNRMVDRSFNGWTSFFSKVDEHVGIPVSASRQQELARVLLTKHKLTTNEFVSKLSDANHLKRLTGENIRVFNAVTSAHPFHIDPFEEEVQVGGKFLAAALEREYSINDV